MSTTMTLTMLINAVRQRADMVNSQFCTDAELTSYINQSYFELYDLLVSRYGDNYYVVTPPPSFQTDGTTFQYPLPADFYKLLGVDLALAPNLDSFITIKPFMFADRNRYSVPNFQSFYGVTNLRYRLNGNNLWLTPIPAANQTIRLWYIPRMATLAAPSDTADGISGWTEYIIVDAAMKALNKEESDCSVLMADKAGLIARIEAAAENRDAGSPPKVADTMYNDFFWPTGSGNGDGSGAF